MAVASWPTGYFTRFQQLVLMRLHYLFAGMLLAVSTMLGRAADAQPGQPCTVFVVGGTGRGDAAQLTRTLKSVRAQADSLGYPSTLVLLDDRLGPALLPPSETTLGTPAQAALLAQLHDFPGRLVVVPGGTDDASDERLARLLATPPGRPGALVPDLHCPGPVELALDAGHTLVVLNTTWWLRPVVPAAQATTCEALDQAGVLALLNDILRRNQGRQVLLVGQHALARAGFAAAVLPNPGYQQLGRSLRGTLEHYPGLTYIGGHGRRTRYDEQNALHYFVSGAEAPAQVRHTASAADDGFGRLDYLADGQVRATYWQPDRGLAVAERHWTTPSVAPPKAQDSLAAVSIPTTTLVQASAQYRAGRFKTWLQGANYRREWQQKVSVPVLNMTTAHGGLTPLKRGGGYQTKSLRLRAADGREFVLRSIEKNTDASVPDFLHDTFAAAIVQDQTSAAHPYAALAVPPLAEAAGVGHTTPELVLVPDDPRLGIYRREFAGTLALFEARDPAPPRSFAGQPEKKLYSTPDVLTQLQASARNRVDQRAVLRARLLDMMLADWDRHDDQWRWLAYPLPGGGKLFRALPRDRDQAFFVNEGFLPRQASKDYILPRIQGFATGFRNVNTFNYQARYFDHSFLTELSRADWLALADSVQASLSDEVLKAGLHQWPDSIYRLSGPIILAKLQAHRAHLHEWADQYYHFLAQAVEVVGSDNAEEFEVLRQDDEHTRVTVYTHPPTGSRRVGYQRTFLTSETQEIRLYGQGGADVFHLSGPVGRGPVVRIVGGEGLDTLHNESVVASGRRKITVYDKRGGIVLAAHSPGARLRLASASEANQYNRTAFQYAFAGPLYPWSYNIDDGLFVGIGLLLKRPGFHKLPWAATHTFTANVALRTAAFNFGYEGLFTHILGAFDLQLRAALQAPNYVRSFYGLGNDTQLVPDESTGAAYYRIRFRNLTATALLRHQLGLRGTGYGGPIYQGVSVEENPGRLLAQTADARLHPATLFAPKQYLGARLGYELTSAHARAELPQGVHAQTELLALRPLTAASRPLTQLSAEVALYRSFRFPLRLTLATRFGGTVNFSEDYEFFQAATLGGLANLRGFGRTRFAGRQSAYNNTEVRLQVARFRSYLLPATFGLLAFHDVGRVWLPGEASSTWHQGYGPGLWLAPTPEVVVAAIYGISSEDQLVLIRLGFFF